MITASYEKAVQAEMVAMARRNGALRGDLIIIRATLAAHLPNITNDGMWAALTDCVERIDRALAGEEQP